VVTEEKALSMGRVSARFEIVVGHFSGEKPRVSEDLRIWGKDICKWVWGLAETQRVNQAQFLD
jgi:hypothetical protein